MKQEDYDYMVAVMEGRKQRDPEREARLAKEGQAREEAIIAEKQKLEAQKKVRTPVELEVEQREFNRKVYGSEAAKFYARYMPELDALGSAPPAASSGGVKGHSASPEKKLRIQYHSAGHPVRQVLGRLP